MRARTSGRQLARNVDRWLPPALRRSGRDVLRRVRPPRWRDRAVTVVLAVTDDDEQYVAEALDSLAGQTHAWFTVVVLPFGDSARVMRVVRERAWTDTRIVPVRAVSPSRAAAYERGTGRVRTPYFMVMDGPDVLPARALEHLVGTLTETGSDLAVGQLEQAPQVVRSAAGVAPAHREDHLAVTVEQFPAAITDTYEQNRLYRTEFWRAAGLRFEDERSAQHSPAVDAYFAARAFDVLKAVTYVRMNRSPGSPFGRAHDYFDEFDSWLAGQQAMIARLDGMGAAAATRMRDAWLSAALEIAAHTFLEDVERATDEQWTLLREHVAVAVEPMSPASWHRMAAEAKVRVALLTADRRRELTDLVAQRWFEHGNRRTEVRDGRIYADLPYFRDPAVGLPDETFEMSESETPLKVVLRTVRWDRAEALELELLAYIDFLHLDVAPEVHVDLVDTESGARHPLDVEQFTDPAFSPRVPHRYQNFDRGGVRLRLGAAWLADLAAKDSGSPREWVLDLRLSHRGVTRSGTITSRDERGTGATVPATGTTPRRGVVVAADEHVGLRIRAGVPDPVTVCGAAVDGRSVRLTLRTEEPVREVVASHPASAPVLAPVTGPAPDQEVVLELPEPATSAAGSTWTLHAVSRSGSRLELAFPSDCPDKWLGIGRELVLGRTHAGGVELVESRAVVVLDACDLETGAIRVRGRWLGAPGTGASLAMVGTRARTRVDLPAEPEFDVRLSTAWDAWDRERAFPWDDYALSLRLDGARGRLVTSDRYDDRLLEFQVNAEFRMRTTARPAIALYPALADDERGPFQQERLKIASQGTTEPIDPQAVYLQAYGGISATDSQLAIHHELRRRWPDLTLYWGVIDGSAWVPDGGTPLLINSADWYRVVSTAGHLVTNIDLPRWFTKRPGQRVLQTFHGYPSKSMGIRMWRAKNLTPGRIEAELDRTSRTWDLILTPHPDMDVYYREEYRYEGPIHHHGYPRDDVLVSAEADRIRGETRARLGIRPDQKVVLYAPTWRDDMASSWRRAALVAHLDLDEASRALGEDYVFLLRGHRYHVRGSGRDAGQGRSIDVTDYPEVNDLILAADVAVLDYSSLRFDFSLTGRPMVFLVPDLETYAGGVRGFLYDFAESAPGPLLETTAQVVSELRDLDALSARYAEPYAAFQARFNGYMDGTSTRRVVDAFFGERDG